jgi:hypothetical protein
MFPGKFKVNMKTKKDTRKVDIAKELSSTDNVASIHNRIDNHGYNAFCGRAILRESGETRLVTVTFMDNWGNTKNESTSMGVCAHKDMAALAKDLVRLSLEGRRILLTKSPGIDVHIEYCDRNGFYTDRVTAYVPLSQEGLERLQEKCRKLIPSWLYDPAKDPFKHQPKTD